MNLWSEFFNPQPIAKFEPTIEEFNQAWEWVFQKDHAGEYLRAEMSLKLARPHAKTLHSGKIALVGLYRRFNQQPAPKPTIPIRRAVNRVFVPTRRK